MAHFYAVRCAVVKFIDTETAYISSNADGHIAPPAVANVSPIGLHWLAVYDFMVAITINVS